MKEPSQSRRGVLRAALAAGCSLLCIPVAIAAENAKKGGSSSSAPAASGGPGKVSQASVKYQTKPKGDQQCSNCANFIPESKTCKLVEGQISPEGWCKLWAKKV